MNPDELRALADALEPMAKAPRFEDFDVPAFCAWVRAQADAQPVGILTVARFRGHLENRDFDYTGELPEGSHPLYSRMTI